MAVPVSRESHQPIGTEQTRRAGARVDRALDGWTRPLAH